MHDISPKVKRQPQSSLVCYSPPLSWSWKTREMTQHFRHLIWDLSRTADLPYLQIQPRDKIRRTAKPPTKVFDILRHIHLLCITVLHKYGKMYSVWLHLKRYYVKFSEILVINHTDGSWVNSGQHDVVHTHALTLCHFSTSSFGCTLSNQTITSFTGWVELGHAQPHPRCSCSWVGLSWARLPPSGMRWRPRKASKLFVFNWTSWATSLVVVIRQY